MFISLVYSRQTTNFRL